VFCLGWFQIFGFLVSVVTSWPDFLTQGHMFWGGLFELPLFTKEPDPVSSGDSDTVPSHEEKMCVPILHSCFQKGRGDIFTSCSLFFARKEQLPGFANEGSGSHSGRKHMVSSRSCLPMASA